MIYFVIPCYNEEETLEKTAKSLTELIKALNRDAKILFVNDKSVDKTEEILKKLKTKNAFIEFISNEKNSGQQRAIKKGLEYVCGKCELAITLDCDLQDDISTVGKMLEKYGNGAEIVFGVRENRKTDNLFKRATATLYYLTLKSIDKKTIKNHGDFRLMSEKAIKAGLNKCGSFPYFRGIFPRLGLKSEIVYYTRQPRNSGKSKYSIQKMLGLAFAGVYTAVFFR